ncbi:MAG: alpha-1,4-glucan--maltose-1-phosphate maltosyltransferase [Magnetococcus sp. THC-1_WYH]
MSMSMRNPSPIVIEQVTPAVDGGRYPIKREVGDNIVVRAAVYRDGHSVIKVFLKFREKFGGKMWSETPMRQINPGLCLWEGTFKPEKNALYVFTVEAYTDLFATWIQDAKKKSDANEDVRSDLIEGEALLRQIAAKASKRSEKNFYQDLLGRLAACGSDHEKVELLANHEVGELAADVTMRDPPLEVYVDRVRARFAAWYEFFPRSQGTEPAKSATFDDCIRRLPDIKAMGFDVIYLTPIHPIGRTARKGSNNSLECGPEEPGCPYAIGNETGGHYGIEPGLGTIADFDRFVKACREMDFDVALDFAINCSPDHPYVKEHPEWFFKRPDGTIKYAENPPKKYEDIYPLNFSAPEGQWKALWQEMKNVLMFWVSHGVNTFRVDNPHTKPVAFWEWLISEIQREHPEVVFLSEAFTKPPMMKMLAKVGFTQSYTYFTWRNFKVELTEYLKELTENEVKEYMRWNFFANTPDILPRILQEGGRPAFMSRYALAATLSSVFGIYSGFELCENAAVPGKEEYLNSEKYQYKIWDWDRPGNIKEFISRINAIRHENPALHHSKNLKFFRSDNANIIFYGKASEDWKNIILVAVNLDPFNRQEGEIFIPTEAYGIGYGESYELHELISGNRFSMQGNHFYIKIELDQPAWMMRIERWGERNFGTFLR